MTSPTHITPWHVQEYIHDENQRLEEEQQFWSKEIVVRIEYKFCPNLTIIDTPGEWSRLDCGCLGASSPPEGIMPCRVVGRAAGWWVSESPHLQLWAASGSRMS
jgi:hypothetical protein